MENVVVLNSFLQIVYSASDRSFGSFLTGYGANSIHTILCSREQTFIYVTTIDSTLVMLKIYSKNCNEV